MSDKLETPIVVSAQMSDKLETPIVVSAQMSDKLETPIVVSAHQPNFIPYLGFFDKMKNSDIFVIRDEVLYKKKEYHNRNRIRINSHDNESELKSEWVSVPVEDPKDYILHAKIRTSTKRKNMAWNKQLLREIRINYQHTKYFDKYYTEIEKLLDNSDESLIELNMKIIYFFKKVFKINTKIVLGSELGLKGKHFEKSDASEDLAKICSVLNGNIYLSGSGGKEYINLKPFEDRKIEIRYQDFRHPEYEQNYFGFLPNMCALDALFCIGEMPVEEIIPLQYRGNKLIKGEDI